MNTLNTSVEMDDFDPGSAVVLILVGLIASGKSTFAQALEHHFPVFCRCNQDDLGNRRLVENLARQSLRRGISVCIDRTNFNPLQRSHWINIAREFPGTSVWVAVFDTPYEVCVARLRDRTGHPTIKTAEEGLSVLSRFVSDLQLPTEEEGYDRLISLKPSDQLFPTYTREQILSILRRIRDSPPISFSYSFTPSPTRGPQAIRNSYSSGRRRYGRIPRGFSGISHHVPHFVSGSHERVSPFVRNHTMGSVGVPSGQNITAEPSAGSSGVSDVSRREQSPISQLPESTPTSDRRGSATTDDPMTII